MKEQNNIEIKWTLFTQNHWELYQLVQNLIPEYYHRDLRDLHWAKNIDELQSPAHFKNLIDFSEKLHRLPPMQLKETEDSLAFWSLVSALSEHHAGIFELLPKTLKESIESEFNLKEMLLFCKAVASRVLFDKKNRVTEKLNSQSLLLVSLLQLTAASHSLSFVLLYRFLHNEILVKVIEHKKGPRKANKFSLTDSSFHFEKSFQLPNIYPLPYEDLLQSIRMADLAHLLMSKSLWEAKIIEKTSDRNSISLEN